MDHRSSYRSYDRSGPSPDAYPPTASDYKNATDDSYDRSRKRGRSPSPSYYRDERRASAYNDYPATDPWDRTRDYRDSSPYASRSSAYHNYRTTDPYDDRSERIRALEWERYYRERDHRDQDYRSAHDDRDRYDARSRYQELVTPSDTDDRPRHRPDRERPYPPYDPHYRRQDASLGSDSSPRPPFDPQLAPDPMQSDTLLPFRPYAQMIKAAHPSARDRSIEQPTTQDIYDGYQSYKTAFNKKAIALFFQQRKDESWFKEKYSPIQPWLTARYQRKRAARNGKKHNWLRELRDGKLDKINSDIQNDSQDASRNRSDSYDADSHDHHRGRSEPADITLLSRYGEPEVLHAEQATIPACHHQILVKTFPADLSREKLEDLLKTKPGFRYLALGEPHAGKRWHRVGWAMYEPEIDMEDTLNALQGKDIDGFTLNLAPCSKPTSSKLRTVPEYANSFHRLLTDIKHCKQLLERFEAEDREILFRDQAESNASSETETWLEANASEAILQRIKQVETELMDDDLERGYEPEEDADKREYRRKCIKKQLDLHLDLLRTVYHCDYYISLICEFEEELLRRSPRHGRKQPPPGVLVEEPRENTNDESWARSVDQKTTLLLADERTDLTEVGGKSIDAELMAAALPFIKEEEKEKHRCTVEVNGGQCGKLFKAVNFVQKHILNKHRALIESIAAEAMQDAKFFNNYVRDPCRATTQLGSSHAKGGEREAGATPLAQRLGGNGDGGQNRMFNNGGRMGMIRFGNASAIDSPRRGDPGGAGGNGSASLGMRLGGVVADSPADTPIKPDPLPPAPKPLDPRAARQAPKSYQDLDGAAEGDVDLAY
ncbi:related to Arsenite-resistance protein 2 (ASR2) [Melanopsichium pennsylvanicum]|uniref:Related to Arsenite-resistance protein 2 (ASR2) n=2 Tax=Melanopsichium pennsylvanicum TaxID=63383 RepID=A0AAJ4XUI3_9BASI|nr:related to Arsenite-resistance protein 2 (ASR2) [Melanopsichium pennsylvanicum 4]SNX87968.1 related to Arsenite-resistance protein 2 (ASR2) [Melanopsichium pennsylvanicum]